MAGLFKILLLPNSLCNKVAMSRSRRWSSVGVPAIAGSRGICVTSTPSVGGLMKSVGSIGRFIITIMMKGMVQSIVSDTDKAVTNLLV